MAQVLAQIGTPLQLAALALLLLAGLARVLVRSGKLQVSAAMGKMLINRVFALALVALVLGLVSPVIGGLIRPADITYYGAVRSTAGTAVAGATVELLTIGQATTNALGQFDMVVPSSRIQAEYRVQASAPGYKVAPVVVRNAAQMRSLQLDLEPLPPVQSRSLVQSLEQPLLLGQYYGAPFVVVTLRVENTSQSVAVISEAKATLTGPDSTYTMTPMTYSMGGQWGPYYNIPQVITIPAGARGDLRLLFTVPSNFSQLWSKMAALPEYQTDHPCKNAPNGPSPPLTEGGFAVYQAFATDHFVWVAGNWRLRLDVVGDGQMRNFEVGAALSDPDIANLRTSFALGRNCLGVTPLSPVAQDGRLANFVLK